MPKFLAGCHYNEEEIRQHLKQNIRYWLVQINGNKFATGQILKRPVHVVKGRTLGSWAQESPEPWFLLFANLIISLPRNVPWTEKDCVSSWLCSNELGSSAMGVDGKWAPGITRHHQLAAHATAQKCPNMTKPENFTYLLTCLQFATDIRPSGRGRN